MLVRFESHNNVVDSWLFYLTIVYINTVMVLQWNINSGIYINLKGEHYTPA